MSGAIGIGMLAAAVGSLGYGIYNGQNQQAVQKQQLARQNQAQQEAETNALSNERKSEEAQNAANQKTPDITAILKRAATLGNTGLSSTMLTGPGGVKPGSLSLGKTSLLGS